MNIDIYIGNCLETLQKMDEQSVNTCITSPPYWGLRDYGTAEWDGGDPNCDHVANPNATKKMGNEEFNKNRPSRESTKTKGYYEKECPKCGAVRKDNQLGLEDTPEEFVENLVKVFREVKRVLKDDGTVWLNLGDSYLKNKQLGSIPWRVALALQAENGWYLRQDIIWHKPNPMPESVRDRCTKAHEYIFLLSKNPKYYFDNEAIKEDGVIKAGTKGAKGSKERQNQKGVNARPPEYKIYDGKRNKRSVWTVTTKPFKGAHFATFPMDLIEPCVLAGCPEGGTVLDPFGGSGTTAIVANKHNRNAVLCELNEEYVGIAKERITNTLGMMAIIKEIR
jgi:DNA modification methylase